MATLATSIHTPGQPASLRHSSPIVCIIHRKDFSASASSLWASQAGPLADANTLDYRMTVNDPKVYTAPWTLRLPIPREESYGLFEYACFEGNYAMRNLLSGSRAEDQRRAATAVAK